MLCVSKGRAFFRQWSSGNPSVHKLQTGNGRSFVGVRFRSGSSLINYEVLSCLTIRSTSFFLWLRGSPDVANPLDTYPINTKHAGPRMHCTSNCLRPVRRSGNRSHSLPTHRPAPKFQPAPVFTLITGLTFTAGRTSKLHPRYQQPNRSQPGKSGSAQGGITSEIALFYLWDGSR